MQGNGTSKYIEFYNKVAKDVLDVWSACLDNLYEKKDNWYYIFAKYKEVFSFLNKDTLKLHEVPSRLNLTKFLFAVISHNALAPHNNPDDLIILLNDNLIVMKKNYEYISQNKKLLELYRPKTDNELKHWKSWCYGDFLIKIVF